MKNLLNLIHKYYLLKFRKNLVLGKSVIIDYNTKIINNRMCVNIGEETHLRSNKRGYHAGMPFDCTILLDGERASVSIGKKCRINGAYIHAQDEIRIGNNCVIASGVNIIDSNGHIVSSIDRTMGRDKPEKIYIGNNVWIGGNSIILKGTRIGDNSVVGAGSVVKGDFEENSLIIGNPAKCFRKIHI